jgi:WD40 repeat protein
MLSPDTNNNIGNTSNDRTDEEQEDEPVFKFSTITISSESRRDNENVRNLAAEFSCIAVNEKFLVIGKTTGEISIIDHMGHAIQDFQIKAHTYPVNAISIDDNGDFIGSCCQEGKVKISGLFTKNDDQLITFPRPVKAVCLDPNFGKTKIFVTGDTSLILNERGRFGRHKTTKLFELSGGLIHTLRWKETLIAFANDKGVGIYDLRAGRLVGFEETIAEKELPRGVYPSRISWNDPTTLVIACAQTIKIMTISIEPNQEHQSSAPKKYMNTTLSFKIEFYACGLTSVNRDLVILGVENFSISDGTSALSLTVLSPKGKIYEEKAHDPFKMYGESQASPFQFQLEY